MVARMLSRSVPALCEEGRSGVGTGAGAAGERRMAPDIADAGRLNVGCGEDGEHAGRVPCRLHLDRADAGKSMRGAHEPAQRLVRLVAVGDEMAGAAYQGVVLDARMMRRTAGSRR